MAIACPLHNAQPSGAKPKLKMRISPRKGSAMAVEKLEEVSIQLNQRLRLGERGEKTRLLRGWQACDETAGGALLNLRRQQHRQPNARVRDRIRGLSAETRELRH